MSRIFSVTIVALALVSGCLSEVVTFRECNEGVKQPLCDVHEVRISPCPEAATNDICKVYKGKTITIEFDYTTQIDSATPKSRAYWVTETELPFMDMPLDGCLYTPCPIEKNKKQTYTYSLTANKKYPAKQYDIKWKLWNDGDDEPFCCLRLEIDIPSKRKVTYQSAFD